MAIDFGLAQILVERNEEENVKNKEEEEEEENNQLLPLETILKYVSSRRNPRLIGIIPKILIRKKKLDDDTPPFDKDKEAEDKEAEGLEASQEASEATSREVREVTSREVRREASTVLRRAFRFLQDNNIETAAQFPDIASPYILDVDAEQSDSRADNLYNSHNIHNNSDNISSSDPYIWPRDDPYMVGHLLEYLFSTKFGSCANYLQIIQQFQFVPTFLKNTMLPLEILEEQLYKLLVL